MKRHIVFILIILLFCSCNPHESWIRKHEVNNSFSGYVVSKYKDSVFGGRYQSLMVLKNNYAKKVYSIYNEEIFNLIDAGDFIYKDSGTLKRYLIKQEDSIVFYPRTRGRDIK